MQKFELNQKKFLAWSSKYTERLCVTFLLIKHEITLSLNIYLCYKYIDLYRMYSFQANSLAGCLLKHKLEHIAETQVSQLSLVPVTARNSS